MEKEGAPFASAGVIAWGAAPNFAATVEMTHQLRLTEGGNDLGLILMEVFENA